MEDAFKVILEDIYSVANQAKVKKNIAVIED